jgi:plasmid maintenance system killer protein
LTVARHDWNTFDHGLADDQAIKRILLVVRDVQLTARKKLVMLDAAPDLNDLRIPPGNQLEVV